MGQEKGVNEAVRVLKRKLQSSLAGLEKVAPAGGLLTPQPSDSEGEDLEPSPFKIPKQVSLHTISSYPCNG